MSICKAVVLSWVAGTAALGGSVLFAPLPAHPCPQQRYRPLHGRVTETHSSSGSW